MLAGYSERSAAIQFEYLEFTDVFHKKYHNPILVETLDQYTIHFIYVHQSVVPQINVFAG